jgi:hypothetical protein
MIEIAYHVNDSGNYVTISVDDTQPVFWLEVPDPNMAMEINTVANALLASRNIDLVDQVEEFFEELSRDMWASASRPPVVD